jgi:hypothetical protein
MPQVLTTNALILCPHAGKGTTLPNHRKWQINNGYVAVEGDQGTLACPFVPLPCGGYQLKSMGLNATQIDGQKVILVTDFNLTQTGLPLVMAEFHQTFDNSTPAPIPEGQPAPAATPEMADFDSPTVAPVFQTMPFSITTPVPVVFTFTMTAKHPLQWVLTLINEPLKRSVDLRNGLPGATVVPSGGQWTTPSLTVTVTLTPVFMTALTVGNHHLYLTSVSKRGLSGHAEALLAVSA